MESVLIQQVSDKEISLRNSSTEKKNQTDIFGYISQLAEVPITLIIDKNLIFPFLK